MKCPKCQGRQIKKILYGMPDFENFDFQKYQVGGCTGTEEEASHWCVNCEKGFRKATHPSG